MSAFIWRCIYAAVGVFVFWWVFPAFCVAIGMTLSAAFLNLLHVAVPCLALLYVFFGPPPRTPW